MQPSEIRGVFVKWLNPPVTTWETLATDYEDYGINWLVGEACGTYFSRSNLESLGVSDQTYDYIGEGIIAAHAHGMKFTAMMLIGYRDAVDLDEDIDAVNQDGDLIHWTCPIKAHDLIVSVCTEIATDWPNLDGFMWDYIRYTTDSDYSDCYCEQCHQRFVVNTGLTDTDWPTDVIGPAGKYYMNWLEWRVRPITELVRDTRAAMLAINPNLEFSIAALGLWYIAGVGYGFPIRKWFGQDTADMVAKGYIDVVCSMQYTADLGLLEGVLNTCAQYFVGDYEGKVAFVPLIGGLEDVPGDMTPAQLASCVNLCESLGTDGFLIYREIPGFAAEYLSQIPNNATFTITNLQTHSNANSVTFTWNTSVATTPTVEYSTTPLFYEQEHVWGDGFKYYEVIHAIDTIKIVDPVGTSHSITVPLNSQFNYRVQSSDGTVTLSSEELTYQPTQNTVTGGNLWQPTHRRRRLRYSFPNEQWLEDHREDLVILVQYLQTKLGRGNEADSQ